MGDLLFLSHRIPYPPDKGEKIRAWHILRHLASARRVHVGCFVDDPADWAHVPALRQSCHDLACFGLDRGRARLRALARLRPGLPLSVAYFTDPRLRGWVAGKLASGAISAAFVYCSAMAPYVMKASGLRRVLDMVDVDSEKWRDYALRAVWPGRMVWAREARTLLAFERRAAADFDRTVLVSSAEADRFAALAPECSGRLASIDNGVDLDRFAAGDWPSPFAPGGPDIVFTGTMDYWPNIDAVEWFVSEVMPIVRARHPGARFSIVGANPTPRVARLRKHPHVTVTGRVADVRPYLTHATAVVAPLRLARGIQNKVLEAMAMGRPVVASPEAFEGIKARPGRDLLVAAGAHAFADSVSAILRRQQTGLGSAARAAMRRHYAWAKVLAGLDALLDDARPPVSGMTERHPESAMLEP